MAATRGLGLFLILAAGLARAAEPVAGVQGYWRQETEDECAVYVAWTRIDPDLGFANWGRVKVKPACDDGTPQPAQYQLGRYELVGNVARQLVTSLDGQPVPPRQNATKGRHFVLDGDRLNLSAWASRDPEAQGFVRTWRNSDPYPDSILRILPDGTWSDERLKYRSQAADMVTAMEEKLVAAPDPKKAGGGGRWTLEGETLVLRGDGHLTRRSWPQGECRLVLRRGYLVDPSVDEVRIAAHATTPPAALTSWLDATH